MTNKFYKSDLAIFLGALIFIIGSLRLYIINGGQRYSLKLFLRRNFFNGGNTDVPDRFYPRY